MPAHTMPDIDRFLMKTERDDATGCLNWTAAKTQGYGSFGVRSKVVRANRYALEQKLGRPLRPGMQACHTCDNPSCVEGEHLYEGTQKQNSEDAVERDLIAFGMRSGTRVLDEDQVREIARRVKAGELQVRVAEAFGVHQSTVSRIVRGLRWRRLEVA